jgi:acyl-CoA reductase-like NAD-dependent aldehyde dehydrogenase
MIHNPTSADAEVSDDVQRYDMYIAGSRHKPASGQYIPTDNPYTGRVWGEIARGTKADVDQAVAAAKAALPVWNALKPSERGRALVRLSDLIESHAGSLAAAEVRDNGKLYSEMLPQMRLMSATMRDCATRSKDRSFRQESRICSPTHATSRWAWSG